MTQHNQNYKNKSSVRLWYPDFYYQLNIDLVCAQEYNFLGVIKMRGHLTPILSKSSDYLSCMMYSSLLSID